MPSEAQVSRYGRPDADRCAAVAPRRSQPTAATRRRQRPGACVLHRHVGSKSVCSHFQRAMRGPTQNKVDAQGDEAEEQPLDPVAEQARGGASDDEALAIDVGVLRAPPLFQNEREWITEAEGEDCDEEADSREFGCGGNPTGSLGFV